MNPYQQAVIDVEKREAQKDFTNKILPQFEKFAVDAGGMSGLGTRAGLQAGLLGEAQGQRLGDIQSKGLQQAFNQGRQEFNAQKLRERGQAQDLAKAGPAMFASGLAEQGALTGVGEQRRGLAQEALDEAYFRFLEERGEPQAALAEYSGTVYANPLNTIPSMNKTTTSPGAQGPSTGSQLLGLGMQAASMYYGGGFGGMGGGMTRAEGGRLSDGLSGMVYRQKAGQVLPTNIEREMRQRGLLKKGDDMYGEETADVSSPVFTKEDILKQNREIFDINRQLEGTTDADEIRILQSKREEIRNNPPVAPTPASDPQSSKGLTAVAKDISRGVVSPNLQGQGLMVSEEIDPANPTGLARATRTPPPADPNAQPTDPLAYPRQTMYELLGKLGDKTSRDETLQQRTALAEKSKKERTDLIIEQRKSEAEAFKNLSKSQTTRLADEYARRKEEVTGRDWNMTLSKAFGVGAKSFGDPNLSIVQQISGAMGGMNETMVGERLLQREQLSELEKEEFDKETLIIDKQLENNLQTLKNNNKQDFALLNLDSETEKELLMLPAELRSAIIADAAKLSDIVDNLTATASKDNDASLSTYFKMGEAAVAVANKATIDADGNISFPKGDKALYEQTMRKIAAETAIMRKKLLTKWEEEGRNKQAGARAYEFATAGLGSTAPAATPDAVDFSSLPTN
jgi:hypothetical protein